MSLYKEQEDVLLGVNNLKGLVVELRQDLPTLFEPFYKVQEHLNQLSGLEEIYSLKLDIDEKEILDSAVDSIMDNSDIWRKLIEEIDVLISDMENWKDNANEDSEDEIDLADGYLTEFEKIQEKLDTVNIDFSAYDTHLDAVDDILADIFNMLEEFAI